MEEMVFGTLSTPDQRLARHQQEHSGVRHNNMVDPQPPLPGQLARLTVWVNLPHPVARVTCRLHTPEQADIPFTFVGSRWDPLGWNYLQVWQADLPGYPAGTIVRYHIDAEAAEGGGIISADNHATFAYRVETPALPDWTRTAIIYQTLPDRFHPGPGRTWPPLDDLNAIYGGTLAGITHQLDYLADLGINCLWLNPFFPDDTHHGYHATDYFSVNPRLGSADDLRTLVDQAHQRGIRLLLDFVANHWGSGHPTFQAALADPASDYVNWYNFRAWPHDYETFFGVADLPKVNVAYPAARDYLLRAARHWLTDFNFDGFRLDYAVGPSHDFWTDFRAVVKDTRPDAWIFGEVVEGPDSQLSYHGRFDGCLDFLLAQALRRLFGLRTLSLPAFDAFLTAHEAYFPATFSRPSFLDNHDMNRFLWLAGGDVRRLKLAALCQFTLSGPPIIYYGTEIGLSQHRDRQAPVGSGMAEARLPMPWDGDRDLNLLAFYRDLIQLRRNHPALWRAPRRTIHLDPVAGLYAYTRQTDDDAILAAFNLSDVPQTLTAANQTLTLPPISAVAIPL